MSDDTHWLQKLEALKSLVEQIMTLHWDMKACKCPLCVAARELGWRPQEVHLDKRGDLRDWILYGK